MLFWNRWNQESAGRVYFTPFLGKNLLTRQARRTFNRCRENLNGPIRNTFIIFCWNQWETILLQGSPELLISLLYMRRRALGRDRVVRRTWRGRRRTSELNQLMPLDNNLMREGNDAENSRLDVSGIGVWGPFDRTFLDITVWTRMRHDKGIDQV